MKTLRRTRQAVDSRDGFRIVKDTLATTTVGLEGGPLRADGKRLSPEERVELIGLTQRAWADSVFRLDRLSARERDRWELLVETSAGRAAGSVFAHQRETARARRELDALAHEARRPARRVRLEAPGSAALPAFLLGWLDRPDPAIELTHLALFSFFVLQLESATALVPNGRIEGAGTAVTILVDCRLGLGGRYDADALFTRWRVDLEHLGRNQLLSVRTEGQMIRVGFGRLYLDAVKRAS